MRALTRVVVVLQQGLPVPLVRWVGRRMARGGLTRRLLSPVVRKIRSTDVEIRHGLAAGFRFNAGKSHAGFALGTSEQHVQDTLANVTPTGGVVYDIGANVGFFTLLASRLVGPSGAVVAFEPVRENVRVLERNLQMNPSTNVRVRPEAVGDRPGEAELVNADNSVAARLRGPGDEADAIVTRVPVVSLDDLVRDGVIPPPDVVKVDVEGAEVSVLRGMASILHEMAPTIVCETHGTLAAVVRELDAAGYEVTCLEGPLHSNELPWNAHLLARPYSRIGLTPVPSA